jgi:hypothetical protein
MEAKDTTWRAEIDARVIEVQTFKIKLSIPLCPFKCFIMNIYSIRQEGKFLFVKKLSKFAVRESHAVLDMITKYKIVKY